VIISYVTLSTDFGDPMKRPVLNFATIIALLFSVLLHAILIGGIAYASGMTGKSPKAADNISKHDTNKTTQYTILPDVEIISDISRLKKNEAKEQPAPKKEEFGTARAAPAQGQDDIDRSVLTFEDTVQRKIQEARIYPDEAKREGIQGTAEVEFTLLHDGGVTGVNLVNSSGEKSLDEEAVSTIKRAAPFPVFPEKIKQVSMNLQVAIAFKLN
jgi:TonB family protein